MDLLQTQFYICYYNKLKKQNVSRNSVGKPSESSENNLEMQKSINKNNSEEAIIEDDYELNYDGNEESLVKHLK